MELTEIEKLVVELFEAKANLSIIKTWEDEGATLLDVVKAYGIMMKNCEKPSFNYMSKVIMNGLEERRK